MSNFTFQKTRLLFAIMLLSCVSCNVQFNRSNACASPEDLLTICSDSLIEDKDITNMLKVRCDSSNTNNARLIVEQDTFICVKTPIDSLINIISHFRKVECELQNRNPRDTIRVCANKLLSRKLNEVLRFILLDENNYKSNDIVFGLFSSSVRYKLCQSKNIYIYAEFDFGLRKWQILDSNSEVLFQGDIKENNLQMLRFSRLIFPDDVTLKILQDNLKSL